MLHYFLAAGVWHYVLKRFGVRLRLQAIATLGLAKLFLDQVLPTAGDRRDRAGGTRTDSTWRTQQTGHSFGPG
jgi:hypothetical protein